MTAGSGFLSNGSSLVTSLLESSIGAFKIALLNLPRQVQNLTDVSAGVVGTPKTGQKNDLENLVLKEVMVTL